jgi:carbon storage regulator CsrA
VKLLRPGYLGGGEEARMLVLDRKVREGFWIDGKIFVKVLAVGRHRVKLGVQAPDDVQIWREELSDEESSESSPQGDATRNGRAESPHRGGSVRSA